MILIHQKKIGDGGIKYFTANYFTILDNQSKSGMYIFYNLDTLTGCETKKIIDVKVRNCVFKNLAWHDYNGPKEYNEYRSKNYLSYLEEDSVFAYDVNANCICPIPMDTIVESTQSEDSTACEHYKYGMVCTSSTTKRFILTKRTKQPFSVPQIKVGSQGQPLFVFMTNRFISFNLCLSTQTLNFIKSPPSFHSSHTLLLARISLSGSLLSSQNSQLIVR